jgi:hypothetical protein
MVTAKARAIMVKRCRRRGSRGANPKEQRGQFGDLVIGDPGQHTLGIDVIELGRSNQCQHDRGVRAATVRTREQP